MKAVIQTRELMDIVSRTRQTGESGPANYVADRNQAGGRWSTRSRLHSLEHCVRRCANGIPAGLVGTGNWRFPRI
jgi:hypothetical protein